MRYIRVLLLALILLVPAISNAAWVLWKRNLNGTLSTAVGSGLRVGQTAYWEFTDPNSITRLRTEKCGPNSWIRVVSDNTDTTGIAQNGVSMNSYACTVASGTSATGCRQLYDVGLGTGTLTGVPTTGLAVMYGAPGLWLFVDVTAGPTSGIGRIEVACR